MAPGNRHGQGRGRGRQASDHGHRSGEHHDDHGRGRGLPAVASGPELTAVGQVKITRIETWLVGIPLRGAFRNAHTVKSVQRSVVVRVLTDAGLEGAGNVDPSPGYSEATPEEIRSAIRDRLAPALIGRDAANIRGALAQMDRAAPSETPCSSTAGSGSRRPRRRRRRRGISGRAGTGRRRSRWAQVSRWTGTGSPRCGRRFPR
ncbi:MAG: hypothetical protein DMD86_14655 [Candidatus Rokuibacteriota bacterium]|nr:MAG: hypothetical protein DMD86_14655 [Candidatus Rokubacteria bacterium]